MTRQSGSAPSTTSAAGGQREHSRYRPLVAVAAGACWTIAVALVATQAHTDPVGAGYDAANRALTLPLVLLVTFAWLLRSAPPVGSRAGAAAFQVGAVLLLVGNLLEFWVVLLTGLRTEKTAVRLGEDDAFWGSSAGWIAFMLGLIVLVAAAVILARAVGGLQGVLQVVLAVVGLSATALWAASPLLAAAAALALAAWLLVVDRVGQEGADSDRR